jgi:N6-adenosine-specific RNA methylase IME4
MGVRATVKRTGHSTKPAEFRALIDRLYPFGRRVELFVRGRVPQPWVAWGNQREGNRPYAIADERGLRVAVERLDAMAVR